MILLKKLIWSNWYSYGPDNEIELHKEAVTQLIGSNGSGKTSIPYIIEEILYNKNSKGVKKQDIVNRYCNDNITGTIYFDIDNDSYILSVDRKTTLKVKLLKNGKDISSHTASNTYKLVESILGMDFKTFSPLIYQSSKVNLQFLTSTDSQRKAFLVSLFNLSKYLKILDVIKEEYKNVSKRLANSQGVCSTLDNWITKHKNIDLSLLDQIPDIHELVDEVKEIAVIREKLTNINNINKKISDNNKYKELLSKIDINDLSNCVQKPEYGSINKDISILEHDNKRINTELTRLNKLSNIGTCNVCDSIIDSNKINSLISNNKEILNNNNKRLNQLNKELTILNNKDIEYKKYIKATTEFENISARIDKDIKSDYLDKSTLIKNIEQLQNKIDKNKKQLDIIKTKNLEIAEHNSKVKVIREQLNDYDEQLNKETLLLLELQDLSSSIDILRKTFSTTGIINYKIEYLVKDLQNTINNNLEELSDGQFQLIFNLESDKLNIDIIDNNVQVNISSLSSGELAKVNIATLLAIRKMMASISKSKINILFLDEIMGVLDQHGKDKLIEILLEGKDLNVFIVSHEYTHPLLNKLTVIKENNISRIEYG